MSTVRIIDGTWRKQPMNGRVFRMVKDWTPGARGGFITVSVDGHDDLQNINQSNLIRINVTDTNCYETLDAGEVLESDGGFAPEETETDEQIIERLRTRFVMLTEMTKAVRRGDIRAMIVSGAPGVGKSHGIEQVLRKHDLINAMGGEKKYTTIKGAISALGLYAKLFEWKKRDQVIVFDDCDSIFYDDTSLNILKAALDSKEKRRINWNTDSHKLRNEGIPDSFDFQGSVIFVTNVNLSHVRSNRLKEHIMALESRCHYIDLTIHTVREKILRIQQIIGDGMLNDSGLDYSTQTQVAQWVIDNASRLRELSLRTVVKTADLATAFPDKWPQMAEATLIRK